MGMISTRLPPVSVEYDLHAGRATKRFESPYEARRFYATKLKLGKNPQVKKAE